MKQIATLLLFLLFSGFCVAQAQPYTTIKNVAGSDFGETGVYYKDLDHIFDNFTGTYLYDENGIYLKFILQKKEMSSMNNYYFEDRLIGGYQLKINNVEIANVLNDVDNNFSNGIKHVISCRLIIPGGGYGFCEECPTSERWLMGYIKDITTGKSCELRIRKIIHNGQEAIKIEMFRGMETRVAGSPTPLAISLPLFQELILIKQ
ncbi:DUF6705 family protein [Flavobacterium lacus]|uniref:DUF6705 domain-containing protein n=1 Tax=Flavobacterium lacus TaxID=1353778 RepID=A0A328WSH6_9FLAO|nr:DUF6705 family protein [Flavobacterium lacus]RAR48096.1 hypothetical protein B0I10_10698 [Flavobacterium lacus]